MQTKNESWNFEHPIDLILQARRRQVKPTLEGLDRIRTPAMIGEDEGSNQGARATDIP